MTLNERCPHIYSLLLNISLWLTLVGDPKVNAIQK